MNEIVLLFLMTLTLLTIFILYKLFDKHGLYLSLIIINAITFVLSFKIVTFLKLNINLGIVPYISALSIIYLFMIKYGNKEIKELQKLSLYTNVLLAIFLIIMNYYIPLLTETISINVKDTFMYNYKILIIYPIIMYLSQYLIIKLYIFVTNIQENKLICILLTYIITALLYTIIFCLLIYINILSIKDSIYVGLSTYIVGLIITIINNIYIECLSQGKKVIK